jgi:hypothetical protein
MRRENEACRARIAERNGMVTIRCDPAPNEAMDPVSKRACGDDFRRLGVKKAKPAANPDAYVAQLDGWRRECVVALRGSVLGAVKLEEVVKWGHLVYMSNGPVLLIRAEDERVLFGFWRGKRLREIEPALKPGGKYEMATIELREGDRVKPATARRLAKEAVALNRKLGDPRAAAGSGGRKGGRVG